MAKFKLNNDLLRKMVARVLQEDKPSDGFTQDFLNKVIQEEIIKEISYQDIKHEYKAILTFLKQDILQKVGSEPLANTLEFLANDIRDGIHSPDPYDKENWAYYDSDSGKQPNLKEENPPEEEKPETGTGDQQDAAKEQGMKPDVVKVAKFMFKHKQLGPALGRIKGDEIEAAQLMVLLAQELGIDASQLQKMQVKMKAAMTKVED